MIALDGEIKSFVIHYICVTFFSYERMVLLLKNVVKLKGDVFNGQKRIH